MNDLVFYGFDFVRREIFSEYISVNLTVNYAAYGAFEAHFPKSCARIIQMLDRGESLFAEFGGEQAMITAWRIEDDVTIYGRTLNYLLTKRAAAPYSYSEMIAETAARTVVYACCGDFLTLGEICGTAGEKKSFSSENAKTAYDAAVEMLTGTALGFRVRADRAAKKFVFEVYSGRDNSLILSEGMRTAHEMSYTCETDARADGCWYERRIECMGDWDAISNAPRLADKKADNAYKYYRVSDGGCTVFGLEFKTGSYIYSDTADGKWKVAEKQPETVWVYLGGESKAQGAERWETVLSGVMSEDAAKAELATRKNKITADGETRRVEYGQDYALGDTVRLRIETEGFRKTVRRRIRGVNIFCEGNKCGTAPELCEV